MSYQVIPSPMSPQAAASVARGGIKALTPPHSPSHPGRKRTETNSTIAGSEVAAFDMLNLNAKESDETSKTQQVSKSQEIEVEPKALKWEDTVPRPFLKRYELLGSVGNGFEEYGRGAWSTVHRAIECLPNQIAVPLTPPLSPPNSPKQVGIGKLLAVKAPSRCDAHHVLQHEARVLTYLHSLPKAPNYLVPFRGYDQALHSLVFSAVPLNLESHVKEAAKTARSNLSTKTMFHPVVGVEEWTHLASHLISGLAFLHSHNCVHGDVKPANILLQKSSADSFTPLFCDFSSSRIITDTSAEDDIEEVTAVTADYTSPELLTALRGRPSGARAIATPPSDVFALGVTLLFTATGESPYAMARMEVQRLAMAREGRPLDFARGGEGASRVKTGQLVDRIVSMGVEKDVDKRVEAAEWARRMEEEVEKER